MKYHDVSVPIHPAMHTYKGDPPFEISLSSSIERGDPANVSMLRMGAHTGTHIDAPRHFVENGKTIEQIPLDVLIGTARVVELAGIREISRAVISFLNLEGSERVLFKTSNSFLWHETTFQEEFVYVTECASTYLAENKVKLVGIDYLSVEKYGVDRPAAHTTLLQAGIIILEGLNLSEVQPGDYRLICLPLPIVGADGSPCRVILVEEWEERCRPARKND